MSSADRERVLHPVGLDRELRHFIELAQRVEPATLVAVADDLRVERWEYNDYFQAVDDARNELTVEKTYAAPGKPGYVVRIEDGRRVLSTMKWGFPTRKPRKRPAREGEMPFLHDWWTNCRNLSSGMWRPWPILSELDRRGAVVFIHPTSPACTCCGPREKQLPRPTLEFMFDTTRCVTNMLLRGTLARHPNVRFIIPHGGATISVLADRIAMSAGWLKNLEDVRGEDVLPALRSLHYDLAGASTPRQVEALRTFADPARLFYGSDWPHTKQLVVEDLIGRLGAHFGSEPELLADVGSRNARRLFPHL